MIEEAGGVIELDLPPPSVGKETGIVGPRIDWYVIDGRNRSQPKAFSQRVDAIMKEARLVGIRPITVDRLLAFPGCGMGKAAIGDIPSRRENSMSE